MAYIRNFRGSSGNRAIISGSNVQVTGSLFGSAISGTTAQFTSLTGTLNGNITGNAATVTNGIYTTNIATNATTGVTAGNGLTGGGTTGVLTLNVGAGTGISVAADTVGINNTVVATLGDNQTFTSTKTFNAPSAASTSTYVAEFRNSSTTNNASRFIWSQGSTYALAVNVQGTATTSATTNFQWITRSTGVVQSTPITLNYNGDVNIPAGNLVVGTSGKGIDFSISSAATGMTSEILNDYEEGTFTPSFSSPGIGNSWGYSSRVGRYVKVGNLVHASFQLNVNTFTLGSVNQILISSLPFTSEAGSIATCQLYWSGLSGGVHTIYGLLTANSTSIGLYYASSTTQLSSQYLPTEASDNSFSIWGSIVYRSV